ncbi:MAG: aromatic ring-hydroxylating dioxygenase subunit alpha [Alphaproteobacteria bacterium]
MRQETQVALLKRALARIADKSTDMIERPTETLPVETYFDPAWLKREEAAIFRRYPSVIAHRAQMPKPGDFVTASIAGTPILAMRGADGTVGAFINVCRHRGTLLMPERAGHVSKAMVCRYHAWSYALDGSILAIPHREAFEGFDCAAHGLVRLPSEERHGFVWVTPDPTGNIDVASHLGAMDDDLAGLHLGDHAIYRPGTFARALNWKLIVDIFVEAYHVRHAHRSSIYPIFFDNLGLHDRFGPHTRNVFPTRKILALPKDEAEWSIRAGANVLYQIFPSTLMLVQPDHVSVFHYAPDGTERTSVNFYTLIPGSPQTDKAAEYWNKNVDILRAAIEEDFEMGEAIQRGLRSGANARLNLGRNEQSIYWFHQSVEAALRAAEETK